MGLKAQAIKNVSATWLALLVHAVAGFLLAPLTLHRLGDEAYSIWILIFAITGYLSLLDLGIRSSIVKYTAGFMATGDHDQLSRYLSTCLAFYLVVGLFALFLTAGGFFYLPLLFGIPVKFLRPARILLLMSGANIAATFPLSVFSGVLEGMQKFSWLQLSQIGVVLVRVFLIVAVLLSGGGLLAVGTVTVAMSLLTCLIITFLAYRAIPVRLNLRLVDANAFWKMGSYGAFAFAILGAEKLRFQSDAMVIGALLSTTAIASFSIAGKLVEYSSYAVRSMSQIFTPMSSQFHAAGDLKSLRRAFLAGSRASALIVFPLCVVLTILGRSIIESWVGPNYVSSYPILVLLMVPRTLYLAQATSIRILLGMERHRLLASVLLLEGAMNLLLSMFFARRFGVLGVAWGTAIPLACTSLFFLPQHTCRVLGVPLWTFLDRAYRLPFTVSLLLGAGLWSLSYGFPTHTMSGLFVKIGTGGILYSAGLGSSLFRGRFHRPASWHAVVELLAPE